ncbi:hypothetical protein CRM22_006051 [Opisthorchis felineus]|uniref:glutathione transferase n=1 Tax=Opisthorchis felineus TaxID=147828 RepID=A0A4S2LPI6_OPIFE|nr:hypothetical protein CRM22_006051 [Opisthorchis felineus]
MAPKLGYWKMRGVAQPIRLLLEYNGVEFDDFKYVCGPAPDFCKKSWLEEKFNLGLDFPNLPYYKDGDFSLTQSDTILRYVAESNGMGGTNPKERATLSMLNGTVDDLRWTYLRAVYGPDFEKLKPQLLADLPNHLDLFDRYLSKRVWLSGEKVDYPDFNLYDLLDTFKALEPTCLDNYPRLKKYLTDFEALPQISAYMKSPRFIKSPYNNPIAAWGGDV